jgi:UDP-sulfoquinovose synthase
MRVLVLGADGYLGWPTCMHFSQRGHEVIGVDNYFRRYASLELSCEPLVSTPNLPDKAKLWQDFSGKEIFCHIGDIINYEFLLRICQEYAPEVIIHYAEQPSAPFSMLNRDKAVFTVQNNLISTLNIVFALKETNPECHIIKIGTMGEYGTPNIDIEEGWLEIEHKGRKDKFLFPRQASSLYHTTKIQDTDLLWFYVRTWGLRVTDLMQGPVYGLSTSEADQDDRLMPHFHYDEIFGTVLNRFIVQAVTGYPLTIYGTGEQIRGYLNLKDTMQCVYLAAMNPPPARELRIFNQVTETFSVNDLAAKVKAVGQQLGFEVTLNNIANPRVEKEEHYYNPQYTGLLELGLEPHYLTEAVLRDMFQVVARYQKNIRQEAIYRGVSWK